MNKIEAWKTDDGKVFESECDAEIHEIQLIERKRVEQIVQSFYYSGITKNDLVEEILENLDDLLTAKKETV